MMELTKERLTALSNRENVGAICSDEISAMARQLLAGLEQEPVACIDRANMDYLESGAGADVWPAFEADSDDVLLYAAPQLPQPAVVVPGIKPDWMDNEFNAGWNACRAAILQGAEPVQGWIPCSDRMPTKNDRVLIFINFNSDTVPPSIHDAQFTGSTFRRGNATVNVFPLEDGYGVTHWMPLPAAPQQEA